MVAELKISPEVLQTKVAANVTALSDQIGQCGMGNTKFNNVRTGFMYFQNDGSLHSVEMAEISGRDPIGCFQVTLRGIESGGRRGFEAAADNPLLVLIPRNCRPEAREVVQETFKAMFQHVAFKTDCSLQAGDIVGGRPAPANATQLRSDDLVPRINDIPYRYLSSELARVDVTHNGRTVELELMTPQQYNRKYPSGMFPAEAPSSLYLVAGESKLAAIRSDRDLVIHPALAPNLQLPADFPCLASMRMDAEGKELLIVPHQRMGVEAIRKVRI